MDPLTLKLAGLIVRLDAQTRLPADFGRDYRTDAEPDFAVAVTPDALRREQALTNPPASAPYAESICLYREIAERLPAFDRLVFHGAAVAVDGHAYLFAAPSGTGKTTHIRLWQQRLGDAVTILNGDKPILHVREDGVTVYGSPWAGKEGWQTNTSAPLKAICLLDRGPENTIEPIPAAEHLPRLLRQMYRPVNPAAAAQTLTLLDRLARVPLYHLRCTISEEAARLSYETMSERKSL